MKFGRSFLVNAQPAMHILYIFDFPPRLWKLKVTMPKLLTLRTGDFSQSPASLWSLCKDFGCWTQNFFGSFSIQPSCRVLGCWHKLQQTIFWKLGFSPIFMVAKRCSVFCPAVYCVSRLPSTCDPDIRTILECDEMSCQPSVCSPLCPFVLPVLEVWRDSEYTQCNPFLQVPLSSICLQL